MKKNNYKYLLACASGIALLLAQGGTAIAATDTETSDVTALPLNVCDLQTPDPLDFGEVSLTGTFPAKAQYDLQVGCTNSTAYNVQHNGGVNAGTANAGELKNGSSSVAVTFHSGAIGSEAAWSKDTNLPGTGNGSLQTVSGVVQILDAAALSGVTSPTVVHSDTITFTLTF